MCSLKGGYKTIGVLLKMLYFEVRIRERERLLWISALPLRKPIARRYLIEFKINDYNNNVHKTI